MKEDKKLLAKRIIASTFGILLLGFGVGMTVQGNVGVDAVTVFITALSYLYPVLSVGNWSTVFCIIIIIITLFINRKYIGYTTVAYALLGQFSIDFAMKIVPVQESMVTGIIVLLIGLFVMSIAVPIMSCGDLGFSAYDAVIMAIAGKTKTSYKVIRYCLDAIFLVVGYLIGGLVGVGTIISLVCIGYMVDTSIKILTPKFKKLVYGTKK